MQVGVALAGDTWRFFKDIYEDLSQHYQLSVFEHQKLKSPVFYTRINQYLFYRNLDSFLEMNDVVFFEWASDLLAEATQRPKKARIITRLHRYEMFKWSKAINWDNVDRVILVSRAMEAKFKERFPENAHKTMVINESVDVARFQPISKPFAGDIGTLCFLTPRKRVYELILAYAELDRQHSGFRLHVGGGGNKFADYNDALVSLVSKLNLTDKVKFYGDVNEPWTWYPNIDIFVSNSYSEGLQVAPMEAMASSRYVLSHHWDGADELLPKENLFLTDSELHARILEYANLPEEEQRLRQEEMRQRACDKFDLALIKRQIRAVVEEVGQAESAAA
jgi:glycosyltransferase involved in cell wall biosynthesis